MDKEIIGQNKQTADFPWVFWLSISLRRRWFSYWWRTRGANYLEMQVWVFKISIGKPWLLNAVHRFRKDYGSHDHIRETNAANLNRPFSFLINRNTQTKNS